MQLTATSLKRKSFAEDLAELVNHPLGDVLLGPRIQ